MSLGDSVWERETDRRRLRFRSTSQPDEGMGKRAYVSAVSFFTLLGLAISSLVAYQTMAWHPNLLTILLVGLVIPIAGIFIALKSDSWFISLLGYMMLVIPMGALCGPTVALYKTTVVVNALVMTASVTAVMSLIGIIYPRSLEHWSKYLFAGLLVLLAGRLVEMFIAPVTSVTAPVAWWVNLLDYGGALLFTFYIMFDWNRALRLEYTWDNSVDVALAIYLDIVNLFLILLRIQGRSKD